ncbi:hypothetical protein N0V82_010404 [Gnomoniopsis sp. IMI 355080]|nr:hypothetical protein N0V82_010404 [Gnomoniopsis sp. IMI 355080]
MGPAMKDSSVEAVAGLEVAQIQGLLQNSIKYQPNLVLVNAGVNDCTNNDDIAQDIGTRMNSLLDDIFNNIAGVTVLLSTLTPSLDPSVALCHDTVNSAYRNIASTRSGQGQKIVLADMAPVGSGAYWNTVLGGDFYDNTHPNDSGHAKMASIWYQAFSTAYSKGMLTAPNANAAVDDTASGNTCQKVYGDSEGTKAQTQSGSGWDDGIYIHHGDPKGEVFFSQEYPGEEQFFWFAKLATSTQALDDLIQYTAKTSGTSRQYNLYRNTGPGTWTENYETFWIPDTCISRGVRWADMNGDGLDDFVCIAPNGDAVLSVNRGGLNFVNLGIDKPNEGPAQKYIRLGDIDGDGRCDYCALNDDGSMRCWRNGGLGELSNNWQAMGLVYNEYNFGDIAGVRLVDINGDGRADYLWVDDDGKTWTYTNNRGCAKGDIGQGLTPTWRAGENREYGPGPTMIGIGYPGVRDMITFGRVLGNIQAFGFRPSRDYIYIDRTELTGSTAGPLVQIGGSPGHSNISTSAADSGSNSTLSPSTANTTHPIRKRQNIFTYQYTIKVWENEGTGGGKLKGDGSHYCNMLGRANGRQDYVWIYSNGKMWIWEALDAFPAQPKYWGKDYLMWDITGQRSLDRRDLTLADWDGDGACDIIYASPDGGAVEVWRNQIKSTGKLEFEYMSNPAPGVSCDQPRGYGQFDISVRFADLTGNGLPDYVCMEQDGRTKAYLHNTDGSFTWQPQVKQSDGYDRANLRYADVDGDGLADLLWTNKFKGDAMVWKNMGPIPAAGTGSSFTWVNQGFLFDAPAQGTCLAFTDLDGNGRADMVSIDAVENTATTWFNNCPDSSGDDSDTFTDAGLPSPPSGGGVAGTNTPALKGLYSFGDSYAAGIGTGSTSSGKCRRGSASYPELLNKWLTVHGSPGLNYNIAACSGDTLDGVNNQINNWNDPLNYEVVTISVGGNDVGFGDLVSNCIVTPGSAPSYEQQCEDAKTKATTYINDASDNGLGHGLRAAYTSLLNKASAETHIYVTSYTGFFNADAGNTYCDDVTFWFWRPQRNTGPKADGYVYLDVATRSELNDLVNSLNTLISNSVDQVVSEQGTRRLHFVDISPQFDGHRWCEPNVNEPDETTENTWLFLSAWPDRTGHDEDELSEQQAQDNTDIAELQSYGNRVPVPDASTCQAALGANPDPWEAWLCKVVAPDIANYPNGRFATELQLADEALASGNYSSLDIPWYVPTRWAKTFHPRTLGHSGVRTQLLTAIQSNGQYSSTIPDPANPGDLG